MKSRVGGCLLRTLRTFSIQTNPEAELIPLHHQTNFKNNFNTT
jgi:hypothetical protein